MFRDFPYQTPKGERKTSDVVLLYPKTAIFLDTTATRIRFEATAVSDDVTAFDKDVDQIILANARQLTDRIRDFRAGRYTFDGVSHEDIVRIFPVIVTVHTIPESTPIWGRIRTMLADRGLLTDPRVEPLQLVDIEEVEVLEALLAQGASLLEILEARARDPERRNIGLKNFLIATYPEGGNEFLRKEHDEIGAHAKGLFFGGKQRNLRCKSAGLAATSLEADCSRIRRHRRHVRWPDTPDARLGTVWAQLGLKKHQGLTTRGRKPLICRTSIGCGGWI